MPANLALSIISTFVSYQENTTDKEMEMLVKQIDLETIHLRKLIKHIYRSGFNKRLKGLMMKRIEEIQFRDRNIRSMDEKSESK